MEERPKIRSKGSIICFLVYAAVTAAFIYFAGEPLLKLWDELMTDPDKGKSTTVVHKP